MALSAFGVEDGRISKLGLPGAGALLKPLKTLKAMPGGVKSTVKGLRADMPLGVKPMEQAKTYGRSIAAVPGVKPTLGATAGLAGVAALGGGKKNQNQY